MKKLNGGLCALIFILVCLLSLGVTVNQYLMEKALKKSEKLFNNNQFAQTRIIADALTREVSSLASTTKVMARTAFVEMLAGEFSVSEAKRMLALEISEHEIVDGYVIYDASGRVRLELGRSSSLMPGIRNMADLYSRPAWFEFNRSIPKKYLTFTYVNSREQKLILVFPIRFGKKLQGIVVQVVNLKPLIKVYLSPIRYAECCAAFLLSSRGVIVFEHDPELIGENVFQGIHNSYPELIALDRKMVTEDSGQSEYNCPAVNNAESVRKLISWHTARIGSQKYVVAISVPDIVVAGTVSESRMVHFFSYGLVLFLMILAAYVILRRQSEQKIRESEKRLVLAFEGNRDGIWDWDIKKGEVYYSPRWKEMLGYGVEEIGGSFLEWESRVHTEDARKTGESLHRHLEGETEYYEDEHRLSCKDGSFKWILGRGMVYARNRSGEPVRMIGTNTDITEKKHAEIQISKLSLAVENSPSAVVITDPGGVIEYVNHGFEDITGYTFTEAVGRNPAELIKSGSHQNDIYNDLWDTISAGNVWRGELTNRTKNGDVYWCRLSVSPVLNNCGEIINYVGVQEDLTELKNKEAELKRLATIDELTSINNRRNFMDLALKEMKRTARHGRSMALAILDIDHFKIVNDTYGHDYGDFVLRELAAIVMSEIREIDVLGRIGGEEFALVLANTDNDGAAILFERLRVSIEKHDFQFKGGAVNVTASFGYAVFSEGGKETLDGLMKMADRALYAAKHNGRNRFVSFEEVADITKQ